LCLENNACFSKLKKGVVMKPTKPVNDRQREILGKSESIAVISPAIGRGNSGDDFASLVEFRMTCP
jgi:hypothetical protein